ncbi:4,5-dihydroxyphthalate decarboxylase [Mycolicibacterium sp. CBMA 226]|uniref:4,5-dihydroxyphthalate decarboxylase n=1 Tax=Mycolicibacterium sp. CBMA 226 TaxID=2606611 RepID=UPI0012DEF383|nr:4,5-dihydroxyphthalate decarboxylase [Mycolicibacterium sp. CBMA 226]MUL77127.1 4,5-dihydroxyphthalate decarboxylase [Mycolicibacterium sp. CBMA 226]
MTKPVLKVVCLQYDTTRALFDGSVSVDGFDTQMCTASTVPEIFARMMRDREFDVAELGLTFYLRALESAPGELPYVAIPVFPNRVFRHSCIFTSVASGIESPEDLVDRRIGEFGVYGQDSGVWAKGILSDDFGFQPQRNRWVIGGLDHPGAPFDFIPHPHPDNVEVSAAPPDTSLGAMLEAGEIDALFTANVPQCVLDGSTRVRRLFSDYEAVERAYHRRTGVFPIMHTVVISRRVLADDPAVAARVYDAFAKSKQVAVERYRNSRRLYAVHTMVPWMNALLERNDTEFGDDWWPYGLDENRTALDTFLRYHFEQGLSARRWHVAELFHAV